MAVKHTMIVHRVDPDVTVPAGEYFLGDPCYALKGDAWSEALRVSTCFSDPVARLEGGIEVLAYSTAWGDGEYPGTDGHSYPVDAGLIGLVPREAAQLHGSPNLDSLGRFITFEHPVRCSRSEGGRYLTFGPVTIDTEPADPEEDE